MCCCAPMPAASFRWRKRRTIPGLFWVEPERRGVLPLDTFHTPRSLARTMRRGTFDIRVDTAFGDVVEACAAATSDRPVTWINHRIHELYVELHRLGHCHSVETWQDGELVGGLYGVRLGGAFFGESMFSRATDSSKVALVHLVDRLNAGGFTLLDTQFTTAHLEQFGVKEVPRKRYRRMLEAALEIDADFYAIEA